MEYPSIRGEDFPDYAKNDTWNLSHAYLDAYIQRLIEDYTGDIVQAISRLKHQCANMTFADRSRYNITFQQVIHKGGYSTINYIKIFHNTKATEISVGNIYSEDQLCTFFWKNSRKV